MFLVLADLGALALALPATFCIRYREWPSGPDWTHLLELLLPTLVVWLALLFVAGLHSPERVHDRGPDLPRLIPAAILYVLFVAAGYYLLGRGYESPKTILAVFGAVSTGALALARIGSSWLFRVLLPKTKVIMIGGDTAALELARELDRRSELGFTVSVANSAQEASAFLALNGADIVVIGEDSAVDEGARDLLMSLLGQPIAFVGIAEFFEATVGKVPVGLISDIWLLKSIDLRAKAPVLAIKRLLDLLFSLVGLIVTAPLWPMIAIAIKLESPGPLLFKQSRLGRLGRPFTILKFRTMRIEANDQRPTETADRRITRLGAIIRGMRLDELPQLVNVWVGDMSLVGPRPERPELAERLSRVIPFYKERLVIRPGLTGWDQVSGEYHSPSVEDTYKKLQLDLYYVKNLSIALDVAIGVRTVMTVLQRSGR